MFGTKSNLDRHIKLKHPKCVEWNKILKDILIKLTHSPGDRARRANIPPSGQSISIECGLCSHVVRSIDRGSGISLPAAPVHTASPLMFMIHIEGTFVVTYPPTRSTGAASSAGCHLWLAHSLEMDPVFFKNYTLHRDLCKTLSNLVKSGDVPRILIHTWTIRIWEEMYCQDVACRDIWTICQCHEDREEGIWDIFEKTRIGDIFVEISSRSITRCMWYINDVCICSAVYHQGNCSDIVSYWKYVRLPLSSIGL